MTTATELNQAISDLARYTKEDLESMTVTALRKKLRSVRVTMLIQQGKEVPVSRGRKKALVDAILKITAKEKIVERVVPNLSPQSLDAISEYNLALDEETDKDYAKIVETIYQDFHHNLKRKWDEKSQTFRPENGFLSALANSLYQRIFQIYPGDQQYHVRLNARGAILKRLYQAVDAELKNTWLSNQAKLDLDQLRLFLFLISKSDSELKTNREKETDNTRGRNRQVVDISRLLTRAKQTLENLRDDSPAKQWRDVSIALALVTGRRIFAEILTDHATFTEVNSDTELQFFGQSKTKRETLHLYKPGEYKDEVIYNIPTLVSARLCKKALDWLGKVGKRVEVIDGDVQRARAKANSRYSKDLGAWFKRYWLSELKYLSESECPKKVTLHTLRELYTLAACKLFAGVNHYEIDYAARILGHSPGDTATAQKYQKDFLLADNSLDTIRVEDH